MKQECFKSALNLIQTDKVGLIWLYHIRDHEIIISIKQIIITLDTKYKEKATEIGVGIAI